MGSIEHMNAGVSELPFGSDPDMLNRFLSDMMSGIGCSRLPEVTDVVTIRNPYSRVYRTVLRCDGDERVVYIKHRAVLHQNRERVLSQLAAEYEVMNRMAMRQSNRQAGHGVAVPLAYYPSLPALVTLGVEGMTLRRVYQRELGVAGRLLGRNSLPSLVSLCGQWLREFHCSTARGHEAFDSEQLLDYNDVRIRLLKDGNPDLERSMRVPKGLFEAFRNTLKERISRLQPQENLVAGRHNDYSSHNIISGDECIRVIDFGMFDYGSAAFDASTFWLDLEYLKADPMLSTAKICALQDVFIEAYGLVNPSDPVFEVVMTRSILLRLLLALDRRKQSRFSSIYWNRAAMNCRDWLVRFTEGG